MRLIKKTDFFELLLLTVNQLETFKNKNEKNIIKCYLDVVLNN